MKITAAPKAVATFCATLTHDVSLFYITQNTHKQSVLLRGSVIKIYSVTEFGVVASARTVEDGCQNGNIFALDFYQELPDCNTFTC